MAPVLNYRKPLLALVLTVMSDGAFSYQYQKDYTYIHGSNDIYTGTEYYEHKVLYDSSSPPIVATRTDAGITTGEEFVAAGSSVSFMANQFNNDGVQDVNSLQGSKAHVSTTRAMAYEVDIIAKNGSQVSVSVPLTIDWTLKNFLSSEAFEADPVLKSYYVEQQGATAGIFIGNANYTLLSTEFTEHGVLSKTDHFEWNMDWGQMRVGLLANAWSSMELTQDLFQGDTGNSIFGEFYTSLAISYADPIITIDPSWELANEYSLNFNYPDLQDIPQVPIPASLFMFGPALLGFIGLRRKTNKLA